MVLKSLREGKSLQEIAKITKASPQKIGETIAKLQLQGLVSPDGSLTVGGAEASEKGTS